MLPTFGKVFQPFCHASPINESSKIPITLGTTWVLKRRVCVGIGTGIGFPPIPPILSVFMG